MVWTSLFQLLQVMNVEVSNTNRPGWYRVAMNDIIMM